MMVLSLLNPVVSTTTEHVVAAKHKACLLVLRAAIDNQVVFVYCSEAQVWFLIVRPGQQQKRSRT